MGLDAVVRCRCWEEGKLSSPPPFAQDVSLDEEGWPELKNSRENNLERYLVFDRWRKTCCTHPDMRMADEAIANWSGYRRFQQQLRYFGIEQFPILAEILPEANGGQVPSEKAAAALRELDDFAGRDFGTNIVLIDADTGQQLYEYIESYKGVFSVGPDGTAGVDPRGYFVRHKQETLRSRLGRLMTGIQPKRRKRIAGSGVEVVIQKFNLMSRLANWLTKSVGEPEVFRSIDFTQERVGEKQFKLTDERTSATVITSFGIGKSPPYTEGRQGHDGHLTTEYPAHLRVERRKLTSDKFDYVLRPLRIVFQASVDTGNPVCWR